MFLTNAELAELTGYTNPAYQSKWLTTRGYPFEVSVLRRPRVLRAYVERRLGLATTVPAGQTEPDFSSWRKSV